MNKLLNLFLFTPIFTVIFLWQPARANILVEQQEIISLEKQAEQFYQANQYQEAINILEKVIKYNQESGDITSSAIAYRNLALAYQKLGKWQLVSESLDLAETITNKIDNETVKNKLLAQILEVKGQRELSLGRPQSALEVWDEAISLYEEQNDILGYTQAKIYRASALQALGFYSQAIKTLMSVKEQLKTETNLQIKAQALLNISNVFTRIGKYEESIALVQENLIDARKLPDSSLIAEMYLSLGHNYRLQFQPETALKYYQQAINVSNNSQVKLRAKLASLEILTNSKTSDTTQEIQEIKTILAQLPPQQTTLQAKLNLVHNLVKQKANSQQIIPLIIETIQQAKSLNIPRIETEALGILGNLYEQNQQWQEAEKITERALLIAQNINAKELTYQWQWQLGRILQAQNKTQQAIASYTEAVNNLQLLRSDLVAISSDLQYSFQEKIEPVYRELAALLLQPGASQKDLNQARQVIELLQVAELDNFFRDACLDTQPVQVDSIDPTAAVLYTIKLENRLEVIAAIPNQPLKHYSQELPPSELEIVVSSANSQISNPRRLNLQLLQQVYNWLIRPIEADLAKNQIKTLVFVPDGVLRNLPPATLHDGKQYLIEKYSIAIAPSLQLAQPLRQPAKTEKRQQVLLAGLSEPRQGFRRLPGVKQEIEQIGSLFTSEILLDKNFTEVNFNQSAQETPFRIVHLATHGQFSSNSDNTFVLTWDEKIDIDELNSLIRGDIKQLHPVDLLVLSACETATGDRNSTLGLAGIAVRGGARSTLASLWTVNDIATAKLMTNFYRELAQGNITKAEALRRAQLSILKSDRFSHPFFWSAFILVGNWQ